MLQEDSVNGRPLGWRRACASSSACVEVAAAGAGVVAARDDRAVAGEVLWMPASVWRGLVLEIKGGVHDLA
ncbi:DUF397 domain-containing protein [Actinomadura fibrosa]